MGPLIYSLCQQPVLGLILYISTACAFPPLFDAEPFPLRQAGTTIVRQFKAPVGKPYFLMLHFKFPSSDAVHGSEIAGSGYNANCDRDYADIPEPQRAGLGRPIPVHVLIREKQTGMVTVDKVFTSLCVTSWSANEKSRTVARFELAAGTYIAEIRNMENQAGLDGVTTAVSLVAGQGK
ncbi:hypothetical protein GJV26_17775 [Massilia dura]|uniref:DUF5625 domain-containing protein n=1 Tax=Pseudoduganella dura TaxID=321982 RepID=A0A6I3XBH2_9BURK|nr:DUF5625 family protein [Pseudoduganella dura]MUI14294.1 hypothetical protein [Pseudoduganella dura]GGX75997.1 hypothetical protein GCM10007386_03460 [Pseudoduganella dura]